MKDRNKYAALRGAATLKARLQKGYGGPVIGLGEEKEEKTEADKENFTSVALDFVSRGGELLKRTRKGKGMNICNCK